MSRDLRENTQAEIRARLGLVNMRLTKYWRLTDTQNQELVHDLIVDIASNPNDSMPEMDAADIRAIDDITDAMDAVLDEVRKDTEAQGMSTPYAALHEIFSLDDNEVLLLTAVLAPELDSRFRTLYTLLQGAPEPGRPFLLSLIEADDIGRFGQGAYLDESGTLLSRGLIERVP